MTKTFLNDVTILDEALEDGRLTQENRSIDDKFNLRAAIIISKRLGRPLTNEELALFKPFKAERNPV